MFQVIRGGCNSQHPKPFIMRSPQGLSNHLLLVAKTPAVYNINGRSHDTETGSALIISPHTPYSYGNPNGQYSDDYLHFSITGDSLSLPPDIPLNRPFMTSDTDIYSCIIKLLLFEKSCPDQKHRCENTSSLFSLLINHISADCIRGKAANRCSLYSSQLKAFRNQLQGSIADPFVADDFARTLGISKSHFQHLYKDTFGISFQRDTIRIRINIAKNLLETTFLSVKEVSDRCGYSTEVHFFRQFKAMTGQTPAGYRKNYHRETQ